MDQIPLVSEQIAAGAQFLGELQKSLPLQSAFWLKDGDEGTWRLYVAADQLTDDNLDVAYEEVVRSAGVIQDPWFDMFQVRVLGVDEPLAKAVSDLQPRCRGRVPPHLHGLSLGGVSVAELYIYPLPIPASAS